MAKKKQRSLLSMQRDKLKRQKAANSLKKTAKGSSQKALPPKGGSSAGSTKARVQRGVRRDALAKRQLENFGRALKKTLKQGAAQDKLKQAAKGTKGKTVRTGQAAPGKLAKRPSSAITKSSSGKATTSKGSGKPGSYYGKGPRGMRTRLPEGKKGGALAKTSKATGMLNAIAIGATLGDAYSKSNRVKAESGRGAGRKTFNEKTASKPKAKSKAKPKGKTPSTSSNIMSSSSKYTGNLLKSPAKASKAKSKAKPKGKTPSTSSNIMSSSSKYTGKLLKSPTKASKPSKGASTPKAKSKPPVAPSRTVSAPSRSVSSTNKPKASSGKNPYRVPQGAERKDRMSKVVAELKAMRERSRKRQGR